MCRDLVTAFALLCLVVYPTTTKAQVAPPPNLPVSLPPYGFYSAANARQGDWSISGAEVGSYLGGYRWLGWSGSVIYDMYSTTISAYAYDWPGSGTVEHSYGITDVDIVVESFELFGADFLSTSTLYAFGFIDPHGLVTGSASSSAYGNGGSATGSVPQGTSYLKTATGYFQVYLPDYGDSVTISSSLNVDARID